MWIGGTAATWLSGMRANARPEIRLGAAGPCTPAAEGPQPGIPPSHLRRVIEVPILAQRRWPRAHASDLHGELLAGQGLTGVIGDTQDVLTLRVDRLLVRSWPVADGLV
jgi:hypothetical protein